jgi:hypothetical protein
LSYLKKTSSKFNREDTVQYCQIKKTEGRVGPDLSDFSTKEQKKEQNIHVFVRFKSCFFLETSEDIVIETR